MKSKLVPVDTFVEHIVGLLLPNSNEQGKKSMVTK
jgi:hypothetical protein